jgi:Na+/melibiose symporter-like transporter
MTGPSKKDIATSLTAFLFFVVGVSGLFMFFHIFDEYTQTVHEMLGLAFVLASFFHIYVNWKPMKRYFSKKIFLISGILVFFISLSLLFFGKDHKDTQDVIIDLLLNSPIPHSFVVLNEDYEKTKTKLEKAGIVVDGSTTIEEISKNNGISSRKIVAAIMRR